MQPGLGPNPATSLQQAAAEVARQGARTPDALALEFHPITSSAAPEPCHAVDGSHAVLLDNGHLWVVAHTVAAIRWPGKTPLPSDPVVTATTPDEAQSALEGAYLGWGLEAPRARSAEAFAEALRALAESQTAVQSAQALGQGGLLLVDGALRGLPPGPQAMADRIRNAAHLAGAQAVGVAKRSALTRGSVALVPAAQRTGPGGCWAAAVGEGIFVARLHGRAGHAFRVDADSVASVARLLPYCRDAVYTGYPYPLALAHNAVALTGSRVADLRARLADAVGRRGGGGAAAIAADFHEVLDRNT